jgi:hypothetical protein
MTDNTFPPPPEQQPGAPVPPPPAAGSPIPPPPGYQGAPQPGMVDPAYAQGQYQQPYQSAPPAGSKMGLAISALVLGILAFLGAWIPFVGLFSVLLGIAGLVLGIIGLIKANKGQAGGKVMAIIGAALSGLSIIIGIASTVIATFAINNAAEDFDDNWNSYVSEIAEDDSWLTDDPAEQPAVDDGSLGSFSNPGLVGDGTVWVFEDGGDTWEITLDSIEVVEGYSGSVAVVYGTATPTVISDGTMSSWMSFPTIDWIGGGATIDDTYDVPAADIDPAYRSEYDLEATAGTQMMFYATVGLPEGVTADTIVLSTFWTDQSIYISTGL